MKKLIAATLFSILGCFLPALAHAQTATPPTQHFVMSTSAGSFGGNPVSIASLGTQLITAGPGIVSAAYEFISNPADSTQTRIGSGVANYTFAASSIIPASLKSKMLIDVSNYNITLQAGAGVESLSKGLGLPRASHVVGNFGVFGSYPLPGGHTQIGLGYKWIGPQGGLVKVPVGTLNFTF